MASNRASGSAGNDNGQLASSSPAALRKACLRPFIASRWSSVGCTASEICSIEASTLGGAAAQAGAMVFARSARGGRGRKRHAEAGALRGVQRLLELLQRRADKIERLGKFFDLPFHELQARGRISRNVARAGLGQIVGGKAERAAELLHLLQLIAARPDFGAYALDDGRLAIGLRTWPLIGLRERRLQNGVIAERPRRRRRRRKDFVIDRRQCEDGVEQRRHLALRRCRLRRRRLRRYRPRCRRGRLEARVITQRVVAMPIAEMRYAEIEWPDTQTKGHTGRRRNGDCGKRGNRKDRTGFSHNDFSHDQAPKK